MKLSCKKLRIPHRNTEYGYGQNYHNCEISVFSLFLLSRKL